MRFLSSTPPASGGARSRRFSRHDGFVFDEFDTQSAWIRENASVAVLAPLKDVNEVVIRGELKPHPAARGIELRLPTVDVLVNGKPAARVAHTAAGPWELRLALPPTSTVTIEFRLRGVGWTNFLAWLGRVTGLAFLQRFRRQHRNRQLRIRSIETTEGERIFDFSQRDAPACPAFARRYAKLGMNIVGFLTADLGVGESARCMVRAADAARIPTALVPLKLNCKNRLGDDTYASRLQDTNPHDVNVIHVDPPASRDIDHHHGRAFRKGKYNIAYFAWELPEFPDVWSASFDYYDEVWCPSDFAAAAIAMKSPLPVLTMPHAISFERPTATISELRARFGLPADAFLFLSLFDLNSYAARKNPRGAIEAFRRSGLSGRDAGLVIKVQNVKGNEADFATLEESAREIEGVRLITGTLPRADVYALEAACDCFVSLHRSEGFGLAVAESMFLGKPAIATDWSATAEFVTPENGGPVRADVITLEQNHGPYAKGSQWAEPDVADAAAQMTRLCSDRALAARLGERARHTIETRFSPEAIGTRYRRRLESISGF
jgi:glycosyltransferase involved in cell wall biosynthesis